MTSFTLHAMEWSRGNRVFLLELRELGGNRNIAETAEIPQFLGIFQEHDQKRVGKDGKDAL